LWGWSSLLSYFQTANLWQKAQPYHNWSTYSSSTPLHNGHTCHTKHLSFSTDLFSTANMFKFIKIQHWSVAMHVSVAWYQKDSFKYNHRSKYESSFPVFWFHHDNINLGLIEPVKPCSWSWQFSIGSFGLVAFLEWQFKRFNQTSLHLTWLSGQSGTLV